MAYMNQEKKAEISKHLAPILKKYGIKGTLSVRHHSTVVLTVKSGKIDFIGNYLQTDANQPHGRHLSDYQIETIQKQKHLDVNPYWYHEHFTGKAKAFLADALKALKGAGWYDRSDAQVDYFDTAYYVDVNIGKWDKPYMLTA